MLLQFNFKNYKSFRDDVSLDLTATKITENPNHIINVANTKLLKLAAIYGANASGKSNIYNAFDYMTYYVLESFKFGGENSDIQKKENHYQKVTPFLFDSLSKNSESQFEVFFIDNQDKSEKTYQYGFSLNKEEILEEWLYYKTKSGKGYKTIFCRKKGEKTEFSKLPDNVINNINVSLEKESLIVSLGAKLKISKLKFVRDWFLKNVVINFGDPSENFFRSRTLPTGFVDNEKVQQNIIKYISSFDESIKGFYVQKDVNKNGDKDNEYYQIDALHQLIDSDHSSHLPLSEESSGTLKMFTLYEPIKEALKFGSTLFIDELNSRLHPLLLRNIILTFVNPEINKNNAQLVFTTHDMMQLRDNFLRRDEIWFAEKNKNGISSLYSLAEFIDDEGSKIRKDEEYSKNYLYGKYGAIPKLRALDMFIGEE